MDVSRFDNHPPRSPHRPRLLALPLVVLCAMAYLGSAAHFALVQHATCLEHGEVIHLDSEEGVAQPQRAQASFTDERLTGTGQEAQLGHGAEAHCTHTVLRREGLTQARWYLSTLEALAEPGQSLAWQQPLPEPVARLRLAPKASPPLT